MIAAGEAGGILDTILKRLATYIEKAVKLKSQCTEAVRLIKPFEMEILAHDPYIDAAKFTELGVKSVDLEEAFCRADVLAVCCLLNERTYHLVNADRLAQMKPTAYLVNIARGPIVDQDALVNALKAGQLAGAGLDVLERETRQCQRSRSSGSIT